MRQTCRVLSVVLLLALLCLPAVASELRDAYVEAMAAREAEDFGAYREGIERALAVDPSHPILHQHMARAASRLGDVDVAIEWIESALALGANFDLAEDPFLEGLHDDPRWPELLEQREAMRSFVGRDEVALDLGRGDLLTECFAYDERDGGFYIGSISGRSIERVDRDRTWSTFVPTEAFGLPPVLGIKLDVARNLLWALGSADSTLHGYTPGLRTGLWAFDLDTGKARGQWFSRQDNAPHNFNDLVLDAAGAVYLTDAYAGEVLVLRDMGGELETLACADCTDDIAGPNGIAYDGQRGLLFVAEYPRGVRVFDVGAGRSWPLATPSDWTLIGIDGLYCVDGALITIQNAMGMSRVAKVALDDDARRVVTGEVLQANHPLADDPTTGVVVGDELWYIVNSHIASYAATPDRLEEFEPTRIQRVELGIDRRRR